ncbi:uncharacterized protein K452DRAFT_339687, partial [Aplosporella prunicola CBS 121167]
QVYYDSLDIIVIKVLTLAREVLIFLVYIPLIGGTRHAAEQEIQATLRVIQQTVKIIPQRGIIIGGDFNRQDLL